VQGSKELLIVKIHHGTECYIGPWPWTDSLNMFENRMLRRIFGPKREKSAEGYRRLHNKELRNMKASNQLTSCSRIFLEKLIVTQLVKKFSTFYGT